MRQCTRRPHGKFRRKADQAHAAKPHSAEGNVPLDVSLNILVATLSVSLSLPLPLSVWLSVSPSLSGVSHHTRRITWLENSVLWNCNELQLTLSLVSELTRRTQEHASALRYMLGDPFRICCCNCKGALVCQPTGKGRQMSAVSRLDGQNIWPETQSKVAKHRELKQQQNLF